MSAYCAAPDPTAPGWVRFARLYGGVAASAVRAGAPGLWTTSQVLPVARRHPHRLARYATRVQSGAVRDALALVATAGLLRWDEVHHLVDSTEPVLRLFPGTSAEAWAAVALTLATRLDGEGLDAAARLYGELAAEGRLEALDGTHQLLALQTHYLTGRRERAEALLRRTGRAPEVNRRFLALDLERPSAWDHLGTAVDARALDRWGKHLTGLAFDHHPGVAVGAAGGDPHAAPFDRLEARGHRPASVSGELVTVVVPSFRPEPDGLRLAVRSMVEQTWADLEVIVVDDASGPGHEELYAEIEAMDPRVRVLRMPTNGGSYVGRNAAIRESRGSAVTFQDSDDWSHPCRIEDQVAALAEAPPTGASRSVAVRAREDLSHQWLGYPPLRPNASSLMLTRAAVDRFGDFLPIRRGADSEYAERLRAGGAAIVDTGTPLAITRLRAGSLSRGDFSFQWTTPQRLAYKGLFRSWHGRAGSEHLHVDATDGTPFPVPAAFDVHPHEHRYDLVVLADLTEPVDAVLATGPEQGTRQDEWRTMTLGPAHRRARAEVLGAALGRARAGGSVAVWHVEAPHHREYRNEMHRSWFDLVVDGVLAGAVSGDERVHAGTLLVADPRPLAVRPGEHVTLVADRVEVVVPVEEPGSQPLRPSDVDGQVVDEAVAVLRATFGTEVCLVPAGSAQGVGELGPERGGEELHEGGRDV